MEGLIPSTRTTSPITHYESLIYFGFFIFATSLLQMEQGNSKVKYPFRLCKLNDRKGDINKRWFFEYYVFDPVINKLKRIIEYIPAEFRSEKQRIEFFEKRKKIIDKVLESGYIFKHVEKETDKPEGDQKLVGLLVALEEAKKAKSAQGAKGTKEKYDGQWNVWMQYVNEAKLQNKLLNEFTQRDAIRFLDWIRENRNVGNRTLNSYRETMRSLFFECMIRYEEAIKKNVWVGLPVYKSAEAVNYTFNVDQKKQLMDWMRIHDELLYIFCRFIYYTLARPSELRGLRVNHIGETTILIPGQGAKNDRTLPVRIFEGLEKIIQTYKLRGNQKHLYIFSIDSIPGEQKILGRNTMNERHSKALKALNFPPIFSIYSWKDTGVVDLYMATKDIDLVSRQCRHHSLDMTHRYMRSLGILGDNERAKLAPELE